jgi:ADP-heptose:LPS heptosyltransferase
LSPGRLLAFACPDAGHVDGPSWRIDEHEVRRWCRLLAAYGVPADPLDLRLPHPPGRPPAEDAVIVHPGAAFPSRRWPVERYAAVARELAEADCFVIVTGTAEERPLAERVARLAGLAKTRVLAGRTGLDELAGLVARARLVVCGDTGIGHLATAYGTPSVLLFGPIPPAAWGPLVHPGRHRVLWRGGRGDPRADRPDASLLRIEPADVLTAAIAGMAHGGTFVRGGD